MYLPRLLRGTFERARQDFPAVLVTGPRQSEAEPGLVVCRVPAPVPLPGGATAIPWSDWPAWLAGRLGLGGG